MELNGIATEILDIFSSYRSHLMLRNASALKIDSSESRAIIKLISFEELSKIFFFLRFPWRCFRAEGQVIRAEGFFSWEVYIACPRL